MKESIKKKIKIVLIISALLFCCCIIGFIIADISTDINTGSGGVYDSHHNRVGLFWRSVERHNKKFEKEVKIDIQKKYPNSEIEDFKMMYLSKSCWGDSERKIDEKHKAYCAYVNLKMNDKITRFRITRDKSNNGFEYEKMEYKDWFFISKML